MQVQSSKPNKRRKWHHTKPLHRIQSDFAIHLSEKLRKTFGKRSIDAKKEDTVKVMRGNKSFVGKQGKITAVNRHKRQVLVEGITRKKMSGTEIQIPFRPSNLMIVAIDESDKRRMKKLKKSISTEKAEVKKDGK
ncbi:MAG TPA: 50S ribosomal protein L24 [archaeon]|nr:50S ribosomal protein L24 [archaeon]